MNSKTVIGRSSGDGVAAAFPSMRPPLSRRLGPEDAMFLYFETEEAPLNIGSVGVFEGEVSFEAFVESVSSRLHLIPRYRQRVVMPPLNIAHPTWEDDPEFDIRRHIKRLYLEPPGTEEQLLDLSAQLFEGRLDRSKPLWEIYVIYGLEGGRTGMMSKVHHCLVDGVSGMELLMITLDVQRDPPPSQLPAEPFQPPPIPGAGSQLIDAVLDNLQNRLDQSASIQKALVDLALGGDRSWVGSIVRAVQMALPNFLIPVRRAPFNRGLGRERKLAGTAISFEEVRAIRKACGGTVNDVVLSVLGGALGRYLELHGQGVEGRDTRVLTPVNVRSESERGALGNRVSMVLVKVPVGIRDPLARLREISRRTSELKSRHAADGMEAAFNVTLGLPSPLAAAVGAAPLLPNTVANIVCTNVPGPMIPLYCVGHEMLAGYPMVPLGWDMGIGCAVSSYNHMLYFGLMADAKAAPDVGRLAGFLEESYRELRAAAGIVPEELPHRGDAFRVVRPPKRQAHAA